MTRQLLFELEISVKTAFSSSFYFYDSDKKLAPNKFS